MPQADALPVIRGFGAPAVGVRQVDGRPCRAILAGGQGAIEQQALPAKAAGLTGELDARHDRRGFGQDVDRAANGIGPVQGRARAFDDL